MDPKNLDPKLKEAYDRIMGMDLSTPPGSTGTTPIQPQAPSMPPPPPTLGQAPDSTALPPLPRMPNPMSIPPTQEVRSSGISNSFETQTQQTVRPEDQLPDIPPPPPPLNSAEPLPMASSPTPPKSTEVFQSFNATSDPTPMAAAPTMTAAPVTTPDNASATHTKSKISPMILVFVGLIFFVIYAVLWGKIFGVF